MTTIDIIILYSFFLLLATPLTGFVALSVKHQRDSLEREKAAQKQSWRRAHGYRSLYSTPPKRLL